MNNPEQVTRFAETELDGKKTAFGIKSKDRGRHMYIIGKPGMGKSTLMKNIAIQDIYNGNGFAFIDSEGSAAKELLNHIPKERIDDIIYLAPFDINASASFNIFENAGKDKHEFIVLNLVRAFEKAWESIWSARIHHILSHTFFALLEYGGATFNDIDRMFTDEEFRKKVLSNTVNTATRTFWTEEFVDTKDRRAKEAVEAIRENMNKFISKTFVNNTICRPASSFDVADIMDKRKILIANLSREDMGEDNTNLIGTMLVIKICLAAMSRADLSPAELAKKPQFCLFLDEFPYFTNKYFARILQEARKYKLSLTLSHKYIEEISEELRSAIFGNAGTVIVFRLGSFDSHIFEKEFAPAFTSEDMEALDVGRIYLRLVIDGVGSEPFSAAILPPINAPETSSYGKVLAASHKHLAHGGGKPTGKPHTEGRPADNMSNTPPAPTAKEHTPETKRRTANSEKQNSKHTPFEKAFAMADVNGGDMERGGQNIVEPVSLDSLKQHKKILTKGNDGSDNKNKLKEAISSMSAKQNRSNDEIPEDTLKKILE